MCMCSVTNLHFSLLQCCFAVRRSQSRHVAACDVTQSAVTQSLTRQCRYVVIHIMFIHVISSCLFLTLTLDVSLTFTSPVMVVSQHRVMRLKVFTGSGYIVLPGIVCCLLNVIGNCSKSFYVNYLYVLCSSVYSFTCLNKS